MKKLKDRGAAQVPRPTRAADSDRDLEHASVLPPGRGQRRGALPARAPPRARGQPAQARGAPRSRWHRRRTRCSPSSRRGPARRRPWSTTMVLAKLLRNLVRDPEWGRRIVPIIPTRARTFGMEVLFRESASTRRSDRSTSRSIRSSCCPTPRSRRDRLLEEGSPRRARWRASPPRARATPPTGEPMIPFYIFYSMFGSSVSGTSPWAFGDARGRGFMLGATAAARRERRGPAARGRS